MISVETNYSLPNTEKVIAIHQPNYFPWLGFFYKIYASDIFVFHDNVEHSKRYPTRRTRIRKAPDSDESCWLTVPLKKHSDFTLIKDLEIDHSQDWQGKHLRKLEYSYSGAPFFPDAFPKIENWLAGSQRFDLLADLNVFLVKNILEWLGIEREIWRSSELEVVGSGSNYNVNLVKHFGGTHYLSGKGGENYQQAADFSEANISLKVSTFGDWLSQQMYLQRQGTKPLNGLSVLDTLFNIGSDGTIELFEKVHTKKQP